MICMITGLPPKVKLIHQRYYMTKVNANVVEMPYDRDNNENVFGAS